jgi:Domain of unknown function (DUF4263)
MLTADFIIPRDDIQFTIGEDSFDELEVNPSPIDAFYYFFNKSNRKLVKEFVLSKRPQVDYVCVVKLIKSGDKFTPRLSFSVRDKSGRIQSESRTEYRVKANVVLDDCHQEFWNLISFLKPLTEIDIPPEPFSLTRQNESQIVSALRLRGADSITAIIKQLVDAPDIVLNEKDVSLLLKRREKLGLLKSMISSTPENELSWQSFFEENKWVFGYGLNYQILRSEQPQPHYGGNKVDGRGGQRGDFLLSTGGSIGFTVLVEIKVPGSPLLRGEKEIRAGTWGISKELIDAVAQIQTNIHTWDKSGSQALENAGELEGRGVFTVQPKGIIVIGHLNQLTVRAKRDTFERFRKSIHGIDIITFDELLARAEFIVKEK